MHSQSHLLIHWSKNSIIKQRSISLLQLQAHYQNLLWSFLKSKSNHRQQKLLFMKKMCKWSSHISLIRTILGKQHNSSILGHRPKTTKQCPVANTTLMAGQDASAVRAVILYILKCFRDKIFQERFCCRSVKRIRWSLGRLFRLPMEDTSNSHSRFHQMLTWRTLPVWACISMPTCLTTSLKTQCYSSN